MIATLILGVLVGLDNLVVASGFAMLGLPRKRMTWFAVSCAVCEMLAPIVGLRLSLESHALIGPLAHWIGPICLILAGVLVLTAILWRRTYLSVLDHPLAMVLFPALLSLDNLVSGIGLGSFGATFVLQGMVIGIVSSAMSVMGFLISERFCRHLSSYSQLLAATWFMAAAVFLLVVDLS